MDLQVYSAEIDANPDSELEVDFIGLVDKPAIERNFQAFKSAIQTKFSINEEKRIISGPAMIAGLPIYRNDEKLGEYLVVFEKKAIRTIVEKFSSKGYMKNFNLFHNQDAKVSDVTIFNSFISDAELGIAPPKNFEDVPDGSWFISVKVNNDKVWQQVLNKEVLGFSVEGIFSYVPMARVKMTAQMLADKIQKLINETELVEI